MAYKFQSGLAQLGGTISTSGQLHVSGSEPKFADNSIEVADLDVSNGAALTATPADGDLIMIADVDDSNTVKQIAMSQLATYLSGADPTFAQINNALANATGSVNVGDALFVTGSMSGSSLDINNGAIKLDADGDVSVTGTIDASVQLIAPRVGVQADNDLLELASGEVTVNGGLTATGLVQAASGSFTGDGIGVHGAVSVTGTIDSSVQVITPRIGIQADNDLIELTSGKVTINGDLDISGDINRVTVNETELAIEDINIIIGSGSNAAQMNGGGLQFGTSADDVSLAEILFADGTPDQLGFHFAGSEVMRIDGSSELSLLEDGGALKLGADGDVILSHVADVGLLLAGGSPDSGPSLQFRDSALSISSSVDGFLDINADTGLNLSASYVGVLGSMTASGGVKAVDLESTGYMKVHYDSMGYVDGNTVATATNTNGLLAFVSGTALSPRTTQLSGAILAGDMPSFVSVTLTSSQADTAVFLSLPAFGSGMGSGDVGKKLTIKRTGASSDTVDLVLTGNVATDSGLFEGSLNELTMSSPGAAVNLMWNGAYYEIY